ncbi:response regulator transcription factor [Wenxinia saemankumensis]|uniref:response regulator transcription factor n=1 Tax=Wenxinia saemankumensis TaxID=1447782 RepID=UPI001BAEFC5A|nr:response regulator [Wenxinia saemankumensis]
MDDDPYVCGSIEALLQVHGFAVRTFPAAAGFLEQGDPPTCDCLLVDVRMPVMDGLSLLARVGESWPDLPVVVMTGHGDVPMAVRALKSGASDFVEKPFEPERLLESIRHAIAGPARRHAALEDARTAPFAVLTPRETEVMEHMVIGRSTKLIAESLSLSPRTVEIHRSRVMQKTGAKSLSHLVRMALKAGFDPEG